MTTWTNEHSASVRAAMRSTGRSPAESSTHEKLRTTLVRLAANADPSTRGPQTRTRAQAMMLLGTARRPARPRAAAASGEVTPVYLSGEIGWDVTPSDIVDQLKGAGDVVLRVNSPGGDVWSGIEIYNALKDHPGGVTVEVTGLAASAASFIAMAGDRVVMNRASQLMIHDAMTVTGGNEADHLRSAELLGRVSDVIAGVYATRAGGTVEEWRTAMRTETWYDGVEAVEAGLADEVVEDTAPDATELAAAMRAALLR